MSNEHNPERQRLLASMRQTLLMMESMGVPKTMLLEILEVSIKELRAELARQGNSDARH